MGYGLWFMGYGIWFVVSWEYGRKWMIVSGVCQDIWKSLSPSEVSPSISVRQTTLLML
jgi:hypothetical protein